MANLEDHCSEFSDASGQTYVIEAVEAVEYEDGWHAVPSTGDEAWFDPSQPVEAYQAISIQISKACWRQHILRGLPGGLFVSEGKDTVKVLATYDDLWSIASSLRWLRESPESPANNVSEEQKHPAMLLRKAAHQLDGRLHRIILAWDNAVEDFDLTEDDSEVEDLISTEFAEISQELTNRHNQDVQGGRIAVVSLSEGAAMLLEEIGVEPETPHPEAPAWRPGKHKVTQGTLNDLEQRSINITDPIALDSWKQAMVNKQAGGRSIQLESARKYGWGGIVTSQVASVGKGLTRQIAKARDELDSYSQ